eukprot:scaffold488206_cov83-Attheya_sp.AAC.1
MALSKSMIYFSANASSTLSYVCDFFSDNIYNTVIESSGTLCHVAEASRITLIVHITGELVGQHLQQKEVPHQDLITTIAGRCGHGQRMD